MGNKPSTDVQPMSNSPTFVHEKRTPALPHDDSNNSYYISTQQSKVNHIGDITTTGSMPAIPNTFSYRSRAMSIEINDDTTESDVSNTPDAVDFVPMLLGIDVASPASFSIDSEFDRKSNQNRHHYSATPSQSVQTTDITSHMDNKNNNNEQEQEQTRHGKSKRHKRKTSRYKKYKQYKQKRQQIKRHQRRHSRSKSKSKSKSKANVNTGTNRRMDSMEMEQVFTHQLFQSYSHDANEHNHKTHKLKHSYKSNSNKSSGNNNGRSIRGLQNLTRDLPKTLKKYANSIYNLNLFWRDCIDCLTKLELEKLALSQYCWIFTNFPQFRLLLSNLSMHEQHTHHKAHKSSVKLPDYSLLMQLFEFFG